MRTLVILGFLLVVCFLKAPSWVFGQQITHDQTVTITARVLDSNASSTTSGTSGGGGGGGGSSTNKDPNYPNTQAIFRGRSYLGSNVSLLKNGRKVISSPAGPDSNFQLSLSDLNPGTYTFGIYAEDGNSNRSSVQNFTVTVTQGAATTVSGIFISPTFNIDKQEVKRGDIITMFGQSVPGATVSVFVYSTELIKSVNTDLGGVWIYKFDTSEIETGDHTTKARSAISQDFSAYSPLVGFKVGDKNVMSKEPLLDSRADLTGDGKVNLVDFSILAYWYKKSAPKEMDLNQDGKIDLADFSILAFHWTG